MEAELIYVHCGDSKLTHLLAMHASGVLPGNPIPSEYTVHGVPEVDQSVGSVNLKMSNHGGPVDTERIASHLRALRIFGDQIRVGKFGTIIIH